ncbi:MULTISPECIES: hypothetical protein [unclassified Clostridium]|uniref:hypothetical protein n=1 Tax=unclassified Clostridium TaxID=2614128 RepID=UPI0025BD76CF|nr:MULTISPECIES: hypothetical protein [unclassified Clostridium]
MVNNGKQQNNSAINRLTVKEIEECLKDPVAFTENLSGIKLKTYQKILLKYSVKMKRMGRNK